MENIIKLLKLAAIIGVFVSALIAIFAILDFISSGEVKEILVKTLSVIGILILASILTILILKTKKEK